MRAIVGSPVATAGARPAIPITIQPRGTIAESSPRDAIECGRSAQVGVELPILTIVPALATLLREPGPIPEQVLDQLVGHVEARAGPLRAAAEERRTRGRP